MPRAAAHPCSHPGCMTLSEERFCIVHTQSRKREFDARRGNSATRGYDSAWRALRRSFLSRHPLCECDECGAGVIRVTAANVVDHRISIAERPDLRLIESNLRSMSKACHDRHTAKTQGFGKTRGLSTIRG